MSGHWCVTLTMFGPGRDLTIHVENQSVPVASSDGRYQGSVQVTGVDSGGDISWCETDRKLSWQVTNHMFTYVQPHPNAPHPASVDTRTTAYSGAISSDGSIRGTSNYSGAIEGRLTGSHMTGSINGAGCQYSFSADRI
jgi:hypothetical protein